MLRPSIRVLVAALLFCLLASRAMDANVRNVILMIGDGMGPVPLQLLHQQGRGDSLADFPVRVPTGTMNSTGQVTDSAASGTALACGRKTVNGAIGMDADLLPLTSLPKMLQARGWKIGLVSSVAINDATPAAFYANRTHRGLALPILGDLVMNRFDLIVGGRAALPAGYSQEQLTALLKRGGYQRHDLSDFDQASPEMPCFALGDLGAEWPDMETRPTPLAEITAKAIARLQNPQGFMLIVEGGSIDHYGHNNDSAGMMREMAAFADAVGVARDFQRQHPDDTLVLVTADHDTGGLQIAPDIQPTPGFWQLQKRPFGHLQQELRKRLQATLEETALRSWLDGQIGLSNLTDAEQERWRRAYLLSAAGADAPTAALKPYGKYEPLLVEAMRLRDQRQGLSWSSFGHTGAAVVTHVLGPGQDLFQPPLENCDIPRLIAALMPAVGIDFETEHRQPPLPIPKGRNPVDCIMPLNADASSVTLRYGLLQTPNQPLAASLYDASGRELARQSAPGRYGFMTFTGLPPNTAFDIRLNLDGAETHLANLKTLPVPSGQKLFTLAVVADTHLSLAPDLPYGRLHASSVDAMQRLVAELNQAGVPLLLHVGDVTDASREDELAAFAKVLADYQGKVIAVPGNHDRLTGKFAAQWKQLLGEPAGLSTFNGVQILALDTANGRLGKPANLNAIAAVDPARPLIVISHYQLTPAPEQIKDRDAAIHDREEQAGALAKLAECRAIIFVGHKNQPCLTRLGNVPQINAPQTTQFVDGYLLVDVWTDGLTQRLAPALDAWTSERSRRAGGASMARAINAFTVWNGFLPWP